MSRSWIMGLCYNGSFGAWRMGLLVLSLFVIADVIIIIVIGAISISIICYHYYREKDAYKELDRQTASQVDRHKKTGRQLDRQRARQPARQSKGQTYRQRTRQPDRGADPVDVQPVCLSSEENVDTFIVIP